MVLELKVPSIKIIQHPIEGVHGQTLKLPEVPDLEFRVTIGSLTGTDLGCFCFEIYDSQGIQRGGLNMAGTLWREDSNSGMPTNYEQAVKCIRRHYKQALRSQRQIPKEVL